MERAVIIVKGDVQRVGYRDVVERLARKNGLVGYVENRKPYDVRIVVEGARKALDVFIKRIKIKNPPIIVELVEVSYCKPTGEFSFFEIKRGDMTEELSERIDMAGSVMYEIRDLQKESLKKQDKTIEKIDSGNKMLGEKIDSGNKMLGEKIDSGNKMLGEKIDSGNKTLGEKIDNLGAKQDETIKVLGGKIDSGNKVLGEKMEVVGVKLDLFHQDTGKRFDVLDVKYGSISQNIERFIEQAEKNQERSEKNVEKLMERMDRNFDRMVVQQEAFTEAITGLTGALLKLSERKA
jgi:acylphosphatase